MTAIGTWRAGVPTGAHRLTCTGCTPSSWSADASTVYPIGSAWGLIGDRANEVYNRQALANAPTNPTAGRDIVLRSDEEVRRRQYEAQFAARWKVVYDAMNAAGWRPHPNFHPAWFTNEGKHESWVDLTAGQRLVAVMLIGREAGNVRSAQLQVLEPGDASELVNGVGTAWELKTSAITVRRSGSHRYAIQVKSDQRAPCNVAFFTR